MGVDKDVVLENKLKSNVMWSLAPVSMIQDPTSLYDIAQLICE